MASPSTSKHPPAAAAALSTAALVGVAAATIAIGVGTAVSAAVNTRAGAHFSLSLIGAEWTFLSATALLTIAAGIEVHASRKHDSESRLAFLTWKRAPAWYHLLPGVLGACFVVGGVVISAAVGYSLFWIPLIAGQLCQSAALDHFGLSTAGGERKPLSAYRAGALALAGAGAVLSVAERLRSPGSLAIVEILAYEAAAFSVGLMTPAQAALSRAATAILPSRLAATWWSFFVGLLVVTVALGVQMGMDGSATAGFPSAAASATWWMYLGGVLGVTYIGSSIWFAPRIGSAPYFTLLVCGQLLGSAAIDATGTFDSPVSPIGPLRGVGIALVMGASALLALGPAVACGPCVQVGGWLRGWEEGGDKGVEDGNREVAGPLLPRG